MFKGNAWAKWKIEGKVLRKRFERVGVNLGTIIFNHE